MASPLPQNRRAPALRSASSAPRTLPMRALALSPGRTFEVGGSIGRVFVEKCLYIGAEARIYAIRSHGRGPQALKVFDLDLVPRSLVSHAFAMQRRCHGPFTASALSLHTVDRTAYLLMERPTGPSLEEELSSELTRRQLVPLRRTLQRFVRMAQATAHCHARGVVHRDIKPSNFVLAHAHGDALKLIDFALATDRPSTSGAGTTLYMPPETLGGAPSDASQDVWALGITLFRMFAGIEPHYADDEALAAAQVLAAAPSFTADDLALFVSTHASRAVVVEGIVALYEAATATKPQARPSAALLAQQASRLMLFVDAA